MTSTIKQFIDLELVPSQDQAKVPDIEVSSSSAKWVKIAGCVGAIVLGGAMIGLLGGFGIAGILQHSGLAHLPQWLVNQINTVSPSALQAMSGVGPIAGVITIAISSYFIHKLRQSQAPIITQNENDPPLRIKELPEKDLEILRQWQSTMKTFDPKHEKLYTPDLFESAGNLQTERNNTYIWASYTGKTHQMAIKFNNKIYAPVSFNHDLSDYDHKELQRILKAIGFEQSKHQMDYEEDEI